MELQESNNQEELTLSDGQTDNIPEINIPEQPDSQNNPSNAEFWPDSCQTTTNDRYYSRQEFEKCFADFLDFIKNPNASIDTFETLRAEGQQLASGKIYDLASRYKWLNWLIDKRTQLIHDTLLIAIFATTETNAIVYNWTGISLYEKGKIWLKSKIKARAEKAKTSGKRSVLGFLGLAGAEKQQKPEA